MKRDDKEIETMTKATAKAGQGQQQLGETTALATTSPAGALSTQMSAEDAALAALFSGADMGGIDDGLGQVAPEDIKLALKIWNMKGIDPETKRARPSDVFFDTVTEETSDTLDLVLLDLRKSNEWRTYSDAEKKSTVHCRSRDRVTGTMLDGATPGMERPCQGCPEAQWTRDDKGKPKRLCGPVYAVAALDVATQQLCVLRFKSTSLSPFKAHLNKHHLGRRIVKGERGNWPLFAFTVRAKLRMDEGGNFAHIDLEKTGNVTPELLQQAVEAKRYYDDVADRYADKLAEKDLEGGGDAEAPGSHSSQSFVETQGEVSSAPPPFPHA